jgi:hypothetical protein
MHRLVLIAFFLVSSSLRPLCGDCHGQLTGQVSHEQKCDRGHTDSCEPPCQTVPSPLIPGGCSAPLHECPCECHEFQCGQPSKRNGAGEISNTAEAKSTWFKARKRTTDFAEVRVVTPLFISAAGVCTSFCAHDHLFVLCVQRC